MKLITSMWTLVAGLMALFVAAATNPALAYIAILVAILLIFGWVALRLRLPTRTAIGPRTSPGSAAPYAIPVVGGAATYNDNAHSAGPPDSGGTTDCGTGRDAGTGGCN